MDHTDFAVGKLTLFHAVGYASWCLATIIVYHHKMATFGGDRSSRTVDAGDLCSAALHWTAELILVMEFWHFRC